MSVWQQCVDRLGEELPPDQFNIWIRPLQAEESNDNIKLMAPNRFVKDWVQDKYLSAIRSTLQQLIPDETPQVSLGIGGNVSAPINTAPKKQPKVESPASLEQTRKNPDLGGTINHQNRLIPSFQFDAFVEGKSNQFAVAAAKQVAETPAIGHNPLHIYGGVGLGKTHLMHAVGHYIQKNHPEKKVVYLRSEQFVQDMVKALQLNAIQDFKRYYRSVDILLIDDIQFFANKPQSQEEFFHTFNHLSESGGQIISTSDTYPKEINGLEDRLKSRCTWGLTVHVEPPELETRVAILMKKALESGVELPNDVAFFIAQCVRSNVRELEGSLKRVIANSRFYGKPISVPFAKDALKDLLAVQARQISIENIQKTVSEYYKIKVSDLLSPKRTRSIARPRQMAMALAKELTTHSLPEIGDAFKGRDHTTVLHAHRKIAELRASSVDIEEDYNNLIRVLTS